MRLGSWNVRGFDADNKKSMIKDIIQSEKLDFIGLVETKNSEVTQWDLIKCWGNTKSDYTHVAAINNSGGLIATWNQDAFILKIPLYQQEGCISCSEAELARNLSITPAILQ